MNWSEWKIVRSRSRGLPASGVCSAGATASRIAGQRESSSARACSTVISGSSRPTASSQSMLRRWRLSCTSAPRISGSVVTGTTMSSSQSTLIPANPLRVTPMIVNGRFSIRRALPITSLAPPHWRCQKVYPRTATCAGRLEFKLTSEGSIRRPIAGTAPSSE